MKKATFKAFMQEGDQLWYDYRAGKITAAEFMQRMSERSDRFSAQSNREALRALAIVIVIMVLCYAATYLLPK